MTGFYKPLVHFHAYSESKGGLKLLPYKKYKNWVQWIATEIIIKTEKWIWAKKFEN